MLRPRGSQRRRRMPQCPNGTGARYGRTPPCPNGSPRLACRAVAGACPPPAMSPRGTDGRGRPMTGRGPVNFTRLHPCPRPTGRMLKTRSRIAPASERPAHAIGAAAASAHQCTQGPGSEEASPRWQSVPMRDVTATQTAHIQGSYRGKALQYLSQTFLYRTESSSRAPTEYALANRLDNLNHARV